MTNVNTSMVFWDVMPDTLVERHICFGGKKLILCRRSKYTRILRHVVCGTVNNVFKHCIAFVFRLQKSSWNWTFCARQSKNN